MRFAFAFTVLLNLAITVPLVHAADFTQPLLNEAGKPFTSCLKIDPDKKICQEETTLTLGQVIFEALNQPEQGLSNDGIVSRGTLALKIRDAHNLEISAVERDVIKAALFKAVASIGYKPVVIVQVLKIIDPAAVK